MAAPSKVRPFFRAMPQPGCGGAAKMDDGDRAERIGKAVSTVFLILLLALFAYGYLQPLLAR